MSATLTRAAWITVEAIASIEDVTEPKVKHLVHTSRRLLEAKRRAENTHQVKSGHRDHLFRRIWW